MQINYLTGIKDFLEEPDLFLLKIWKPPNSTESILNMLFGHKLVSKYVDKIEGQFLANSFMINKNFIIKNIVQKKFLIREQKF